MAKRAFILLLAACLLSMAGCAAVSGPEVDIPPEMERLLLERGYPAGLLDRLIPQQRESLYSLALETGCRYLASTDGTELQGGEGSAAPDLELVLSCTTVFLAGRERYERLYVTAMYEWTELPGLRFEDEIGVRWDHKLFAYGGGFESNDYFLRNNSEWVRASTYDAAAKLAQGGLGIFTTLTATDVNDEDIGLVGGLRGDVTFELIPNNGYRMGCLPDESTQIQAEYTHNKMFPSLSFALSGSGLGVSVSGGLLTDSTTDLATIRYTELNDY